MNEDQFKAVIAALENQRNSALNALVNTEAALAIVSQEAAKVREQLAQTQAELQAMKDEVAA